MDPHAWVLLRPGVVISVAAARRLHDQLAAGDTSSAFLVPMTADEIRKLNDSLGRQLMKIDRVEEKRARIRARHK